MERKLNLKPCVIWICGDAFVQIVDAKLKGIIADLTLEIKVLNKLNYSITKIEYEVNFYDSSDVKLNGEPLKVDGETVLIESNKIGIASKLNISKTYPNARSAEIKLLKACFDDGNSIDLIYDNMEQYVQDDLTNSDLLLLKKVAGDDALCITSSFDFNWRCVCGYFNGNESTFCNNCGREKTQVLQDYKSIEYIKENIEKEIAGQLQDIEKLNEENEIKSEEIKVSKDEVSEEEQEDVTENISTINELKSFFSKSKKLNLLLLLSASILSISSAFIHLLNKISL